MYNNKKILAIIPARGGSKGIPKKNIKTLNGKPLIHYTIDNLKLSKIIDDIVLTTESKEIKNNCKSKEIIIHNRPKNLSDDKTPLDPVVLDVCKSYNEYDYIITFQPTSPLIKLETIEKSIKNFINSGKDSLISLREETHLYWKEENGKIIADFEKRVNRQFLSKKYVETGAIIGVKKDYFLKNNTRININSCDFVITGEQESTDIDTYADWINVESLLKQKNIAINVIGNNETGLGHIYRQLHIALNLNTKPIFFTKKGNNLAKKIISENFYEIIEYYNKKDLIKKIKDKNIKIIINDILNTSKEYMKELKNNGLKSINFEDLGEGKNYADYTINELYEFTNEKGNILNGHKYIILRDDIINQEKKKITKEVKNITISCGGTDPNNLTCIYLQVLKNINYDGNINIILGPGYSHKKILESIIKGKQNINILEDISNMGEVIQNADIMLTSNGRTIYEITCIGVPTISISQNEQEMHHTFSNFSGCIKNLGLVNFINKIKLEEEIKNLIFDYRERENMNKKMLSYNLENGINTFLNILNSL